ncbi:hypothetical protein QFZ45_002960 [Pseudomonas synxantha]|nr:hypothetical protein [Pseudomonas synxantha]MDQ0979782.1 hypothetical protein [Pseudomonas synxantha]
MRQLFFCLMLMVSITAHTNDAQRLKQAGFPAQVAGLALKHQAVLNWIDVGCSIAIGGKPPPTV